MFQLTFCSSVKNCNGIYMSSMLVAADSVTLVGSFTNLDKPLVSNILFSLMFVVVTLNV